VARGYIKKAHRIKPAANSHCFNTRTQRSFPPLPVPVQAGVPVRTWRSSP